MHPEAAPCMLRSHEIPRFPPRGSRVSVGGQKPDGTCILDACGPAAAPALGVMPGAMSAVLTVN